MIRTHDAGTLRSANVGQEVVLAGWVAKRRDHGGVAFIEAFTREDEAVGDEHDFIARPASFYRTRLRALGLRPLGSHCWLSPARVHHAAALELPD